MFVKKYFAEWLNVIASDTKFNGRSLFPDPYCRKSENDARPCATDTGF